MNLDFGDYALIEQKRFGVVAHLTPKERERALNMVWFYHVGSRMDWRPEWMRRENRKQPGRPRKKAAR